MAAKKKAKSAAPAPSDVPAFMAALKHPLKAEVETLRQAILGASTGVQEEIKWNAPSFFVEEHFATFNLRGKADIMLVLHRGAKVKKDAPPMNIKDPLGLLTWLAPDRATVRFTSADEVRAGKAALQAVVRQWIKQM